MLIFISGGVRSGKSALGESLLLGASSGGRKIYLATAEAYDEEMKTRISRHRRDRAGKGIDTIEMSRNIGQAAVALRKDDSVLLDCLGTLASNEMFGAAYTETAAGSAEALTAKIFVDVMRVCDAVSVLIVVSNEVFSDGVGYDPMTLEYIRLLGWLHCRIAEASDVAVECAAGEYIVHKGVLNTTLQKGRVWNPAPTNGPPDY